MASVRRCIEGYAIVGVSPSRRRSERIVAGKIVVAGGAVTAVTPLLVAHLILHLPGIESGDGLAQIGEHVEHGARLFGRPLGG